MESDRELSAVALPEGQGVVGMSKGDQKIKSPRYISPRGVMHSVVTTVKDTALQGHLGGSVVDHLPLAQVLISGVLGSGPVSGSLHGDCFSLCLGLCLSFCVSLVNK